MANAADRSLVNQLQRRKPEAWARTYDDHASDVFTFIVHLLHADRAAAEEIHQDTWLAALAGIDAFDVGRGELRAWIFGIARRQVALHFRRLGQTRLEAFGGDIAAAAIVDDSILPHDVISSIERGDAVRAALAELGSETRGVLLGKYVERRSVNELARQFGRSPKAIESLLSAPPARSPVARVVFRHRERHKGCESMTEPANHPDPEIDPRLAVWLAKRPMTNRAALRNLWPMHAALCWTSSRPPIPLRLIPLSLPKAHKWRAMELPGLWTRHRLAVGSVAASIALAGALLLALNSGVQLSAMERVAKRLCEVTSYSYRCSGTNTGINDDGKRETIKDDWTVYWLAPDAYHDEMKIVKIVEDVAGGNRTEVTLAQYDTTFPANKPGLFIDHKHQVFCWSPHEWGGSKTYPWDVLRMIRERSYDVLRDLGAKRIGETKAHGYRLALKNPPDDMHPIHDPVELWVDPRTNLPVEFGWSGESEGWKYTERATDFRWNIALDRQLFEPVTPQGYADTTPPTEQSDYDKIAEALRLYSQLSGGHYPPVKTIDPSAIRDEMLKMVDSATPANSEAARDKKHQQIDQAMPGLNWIAQHSRNRYVSGYRGLNVGPADKDKVLLWWTVANDRYHVFYGDLRTGVLTLTEQEWSKLVPSGEIFGEKKKE